MIYDEQKFLSLSLLLLPVFLVSCPRNHCQIQSHEDFLLCFLLGVFIVWDFILLLIKSQIIRKCKTLESENKLIEIKVGF